MSARDAHLHHSVRFYAVLLCVFRPHLHSGQLQCGPQGTIIGEGRRAQVLFYLQLQAMSLHVQMSLLVFRLLEEAGGGTDMDSDSQCPVPENFADMLEARLREAIRNGRQA